MDSGYNVTLENPLNRANILSKLFFTWLTKLFYKCVKYGLNINDLYKNMLNDSSETLGNKLEDKWIQEMKKSKKNGVKAYFVKAILFAFGRDFMVLGLFQFLLLCVFRTSRPFIIFILLKEFDKQDETNNNTLPYLLLLLLISFIIIFFSHHIEKETLCIGMRLRVATSSLINRKMLKLNKNAFGLTESGQIINLLANDVNRFQTSIRFMHYIWISPIQFIIIITALWWKLGMATIFGILTMICIFTPFLYYCGRKSSEIRAKVAAHTDKRLKFITEIVNGILIIKLHAWENVYEKLIKNIRRDEISELKRANYIKAFVLSGAIFIERALLYVTILCYISFNYYITADIVYYVSHFCNLLHLSITLYLTVGITETSECMTSISRIEKFLLLEEKCSDKMEKCESRKILMDNVMYFYNGTVKCNVSLKIQPGILCAILGSVGSGKSTFLQLLMNEINIESGIIKKGGNLSYASQEPWLFSSTIKNNILFGNSYDEELYNKIINVCSLSNDFKSFIDGDETKVNEKSLSGGQRTRINLARALYRNADIYLLDDPLSSVDAHIAKHIFEKCILEFLHNKTRIIVTHHLHFLKQADLIVVIDEGKIVAEGTFYELYNNKNVNFTDMVVNQEDIFEEEVDSFSATNEKPTRNIRNPSKELNESEVNTKQRPTASILDILRYVNYGGNCLRPFILTVALILINILISISDIIIAYWIDEETELKRNKYHFEDNITYNYGYEIENDSIFYIHIYTGFILSLMIFTLSWTFLHFNMAERSSKNLHNITFNSILHTTMNFFSRNKNGDILNRFSKDMGAVDEILPRALALSLRGLTYILGTVFVIAFTNWYCTLYAIGLLLIFFIFQKYFIIILKNLTRLETMTKTPLFTHINSTASGLLTIRVCNMEMDLIKEFDHHQDINSSAWHCLIVGNSFYGLWLDLTLLSILVAISISLIYLKNYTIITSGLFGLIITRCISLIGMIQYATKETAELFCQLTSFSRINEYKNIDREEKFLQSPDVEKRLMNWPERGEIIFNKACLKYGKDESFKLTNLNLKINAGEKIGIVGRSGAGKSSILNMLLRLYPIDGNIIIDGMHISNVDLYSYRKRISVIPQNPIIFTTTLRLNLDPLNEHSDSAIWRAIEKAHMLDSIKTLDMKIEAANNVFSLGQKQLLCLARTIIQNNKIIILDEATANVDPQTDLLIQETIRREFAKCTVIAIAHRLNTIINADKVIVMKEGKVVEYDHPYKLLQNVQSHFSKMAQEMGSNAFKELREQSYESYKLKFCINCNSSNL